MGGLLIMYNLSRTHCLKIHLSFCDLIPSYISIQLKFLSVCTDFSLLNLKTLIPEDCNNVLGF